VSERPSASELAGALAEALRPLVAELVAEEVERALDAHAPHADEERPYETVKQYAARHQTTPAAVRARIRRGSLDAIQPPGAREYLIPAGSPNGSEPGKQAQLSPTAKSPRTATTAGGVTPKE
jgi:hypothetical protein